MTPGSTSRRDTSREAGLPTPGAGYCSPHHVAAALADALGQKLTAGRPYRRESVDPSSGEVHTAFRRCCGTERRKCRVSRLLLRRKTPTAETRRHVPFLAGIVGGYFRCGRATNPGTGMKISSPLRSAFAVGRVLPLPGGKGVNRGGRRKGGRGSSTGSCPGNPHSGFSILAEHFSMF